MAEILVLLRVFRRWLTITLRRHESWRFFPFCRAAGISCSAIAFGYCLECLDYRSTPIPVLYRLQA